MSMDLLKIAITAALEASKEILKIYNADNFVVELKDISFFLISFSLIKVESIFKDFALNIVSLLFE